MKRRAGGHGLILLSFIEYKFATPIKDGGRARSGPD